MKDPTGSLPTFELQNPSYFVHKLIKARRSPDVQALKLWKVPSAIVNSLRYVCFQTGRMRDFFASTFFYLFELSIILWNNGSCYLLMTVINAIEPFESFELEINIPASSLQRRLIFLPHCKKGRSWNYSVLQEYFFWSDRKIWILFKTDVWCMIIDSFCKALLTWA